MDWLTPGISKNNKYAFRELNLVTYDSSFTKVICQAIKEFLGKTNIKVNISIDDTINISPKYDMAVNIISMGTNSMYTQLYGLISTPFFAEGSIREIKEDLIASKNIVNYNLRIDKQKEIEKRMLQEYCNLPLAYTKSFTLTKNNIISLSSNGLSKLDFGNLIKSSYIPLV